MYPPMVPDDDLDLEGNQFGFLMFTKALHSLLRLDEGIVVENNEKLYIVCKFKDEETGEILVGIDFAEGTESEEPLKDGMMVWMDADKPLEERHKDDE